jgi:hypothetical protein
MKPFSSPVTRSQLRDGKPTPAPQRNALVGMSKLSGLPRPSKPAKPETSTFLAASLLRMASIEKSGLPVPLPMSLSPVGSLIMPRSANAKGSCSASEVRLTFAPT